MRRRGRSTAWAPPANPLDESVASELLEVTVHHPRRDGVDADDFADRDAAPSVRSDQGSGHVAPRQAVPGSAPSQEAIRTFRSDQELHRAWLVDATFEWQRDTNAFV